MDAARNANRAMDQESPTPSELAAWFACVDTLRSSPSEISRIASWRGFRESTVHWAIARGIIGLKSWQGIPREAFLVEMPVYVRVSRGCMGFLEN